MTRYKGYYIDKVIFSSKADIDAFIKKQAVEKFKKLNRYFDRHPSMEACAICSDQGRVLHEEFGLSWEEIEALELEALDEVA